tara:strand:+ start:331 stop:651 length:321 start_codon:yes stop_codon:yes gene_type:complete
MRYTDKANSEAVEVPQSHETPAKLETIDPRGQGQMLLDFVEANEVSEILHSEQAYIAFVQDISAQSSEDAWLAEMNKAIEDGLECRNWDSETLANNCQSSCKACAN